MTLFCMAGKRRATSDLNHDNWEQEEEPEDAGTFKRASQAELNKRIIKTAKRRKPVVCDEDPNKKSAFANFTALSKVSAPSTTDFSFLSKLSCDVTNEERKEGKKFHENERNEVDQSKNNISYNKLLEISNNEISGEMDNKESTNDNDSGEIDDMDNRITKEISENASNRVDDSTKNEIVDNTNEIVESSNNKIDELEEFTNKNHVIDGDIDDIVVSQDSFVSEDKKANEAVNDNSEKKDTNNP